MFANPKDRFSCVKAHFNSARVYVFCLISLLLYCCISQPLFCGLLVCFFIFILINIFVKFFLEYVYHQCQTVSRSDKILGLILVQIADKGYQQMALASTVTLTQLMFIMQYVFLTALQFTEMCTLIIHIDFRRILRQKRRHVSV